MTPVLQLAMVLLLSMFPLHILSQDFGPVHCHESCSRVYSSLCPCDKYCEFFEDCCHDKLPSNDSLPTFLTAGPLSLYQCRSVHVNRSTARSSGLYSEVEKAFWMVVKCPSSWQEEYIEAQCVGSGSSRQPVTDADTGIVYQNEYCAVCNGVRVDRLLYWKYNLACSEALSSLANDSEFVLTQDILQQYCQPCSFVETELVVVYVNMTPYFTFPRPCYLSEGSCLARDELEMVTYRNWTQIEYDNLVSHCENGKTALVKANVGIVSNRFLQLYKNRYCALCNGETWSSLSCPAPLLTARMPLCTAPVVPPPVSPTVDEETSNSSGSEPGDGSGNLIVNPTDIVVIDGAGAFSVVLDVTQGGLVLVNSRTFTTEITVTCRYGEVFDPVMQGCRPAVTDITNCPEGNGLLALNVSDGDLVFIDNATIQYGDKVYRIAGEVDLQVLICYNDTFALDVIVCPEGSGLLALNVNDSNVVVLDNDTVQYGDEIYEITGNLDSKVLICLSYNGTYIANVTVLYYEYPTGFVTVTYIGSSLSVIGCILVIITYSLFKELRTLPGKLLMNLAATILVSNIFLLLSDLGSDSQAYCTATAIVLHMFFLTQFSWMSILVFETGRNLYCAQTLSSMEPSKQLYRRLFSIYLLLGWLTPAVIVGASIAANYLSDDDLVLYGKQESGRQGRCWINHLESAIVAFLLPVAISILFNAAVLSVISVWIYKAWRSQAKLKKKQNLYYLRVYFAIFAVSGICWVFGFIAILADEGWAWYPFIILNSIQGFVLFMAFVFTKKIGKRFQRSIMPTYLTSKLSTKSSKTNTV